MKTANHSKPKIFEFDPVISPVGSGLHYRVVEDFLFQYGGEIITVPKGFQSDWASVPRLFWRLVPPHQYPRSSLGHDWLYAAEYFPRKKCDLFFFDALKEEGACWLRRWAMYRAVRLGGGVVWNRHDIMAVDQLRQMAGLPLLKKHEIEI